MSYLKWTYFRDLTETEIKVISLFCKKTINASVVFSETSKSQCWVVFNMFLVSQTDVIGDTIYAPLRDCLPQEVTNVYVFALILKSILKTDLEIISANLCFPNDIDLSRRGLHVPDAWRKASDVLHEEGFLVNWASYYNSTQTVLEPIVRPPFEVL